MFGYLRPCRAQLLVCQYEQYRGRYCAQCKALGRQLGLLGQAGLRYEDVVLALLYENLRGVRATPHKGYCLLHPWQRMPLWFHEEARRYAADMALLLQYHKWRDHAKDSCWGYRLLLPFYRAQNRKTQRRYPALWAQVARLMELQWFLEENACTDIDEAANPTAEMLSAVVDAAQEKPDAQVHQVAYLLGRWVYLMDAWEDMKTDKKRHNYNVFVQRGDNTSQIAACVNLTYQRLWECFEDCAVLHQDALLRNILQLGLPMQQQRLQQEVHDA